MRKKEKNEGFGHTKSEFCCSYEHEMHVLNTFGLLLFVFFGTGWLQYGKKKSHNIECFKQYAASVVG